jgi:hypothetical protein
MLCHFQVRGGDPRLAVIDEEDCIRLTDRHLRLSLDLLDEIRRTDRKRSPAAVRRVDAAGVHHVEGASVPLRFAEQTVARGAGRIVHDRHAFTDEAVEQG